MDEIQELSIARKILPELFAMDATPFLPGPANFNWEDLEQQLIEKLRFRSVKFKRDVPFYDQNPEKPFPHYTIAFYVGTLQEPVYLLVSKEQVESLAKFMLGLEEKSEGIESAYLDGFKDFLTGVGIHLVEKQIQGDGWTLKAGDVDGLKDGPFLTYGVHAFFDDEKSLDILLAMPKKFVEDWRGYYVRKGYTSTYSDAIKNAIELTFGLEIGRVALQEKTFKSLEVGDFVLLDSLLWQPGKERGRAYVCYYGHPLFLASVKAGGLKIVEQANHYETGETMANDDEEFLDENEAIDDDEDELAEESEIEESEIEEEESGIEQDENEIEEPEEVEEAPVEQPVEETKLEEISHEPFSLKKTELVIKVEVGRLKMTLDKVTQLEPGNILKLNVHPENGVNLLINEKIVGRGELVQIGDLVGVRILNIGS